jgi:Phosphotransferase enzyme family
MVKQLSLEEQIASDMKILKQYISQIVSINVDYIKNWSVEPISTVSLNFTTEGIYRLRGVVNNMQMEIPWSLVLKIIQPENVEKNNVQHHNYWKREALVYESGILTSLPNNIKVPKCYNIEEKSNGSIWIWMEDINEENNECWSDEEYAFAARQLGFFNGVYVTGKKIPEQPWLCCTWLKSWVNGCKQYASDPLLYYSQVQIHNNFDYIWDSYINLNANIHNYLEALSRLPRVLAHQDLSRQNMYITYEGSERKWTLIDWQFLSISGLGEDLGKLFGIALSQGNIPSEEADYYRDLLFENYIEGLIDAGWNGDIELPRYGFYASFALRSVWEVPKLIKKMATSQTDLYNNQTKDIENLTRIVYAQIKAGKEANSLVEKLNF